MFKRKNDLGKLLKSQAEGLGACEQGVEGLEGLNQQELINRFLHFINYCTKEDFPSNEFIKNNFKQELLEHNNIYVDNPKIERRNARSVVVVQGNSTGCLLYDSFTTADVYVRHDSEITIDCARMSKVFISVYDNAKVNVIQRDAASVYVYRHGDDCEIFTEGEVMVRKSKT